MAPAGDRGPGSRCGLPGRCHWYTCPRSQQCTESHPGLWVPAPPPSFVPGPDTWVRRGRQGRCTVEAIHNNVPGTEHHCRLNTAGLGSPLRLEGSPKVEKKGHRHIARWAEPALGWTSSPESHESRPPVASLQKSLHSFAFFLTSKHV